jgi:hydrogenase maturation protease
VAKKRILVLGVGNILLSDEGVGVRVIEELAAGYTFSENVRLYDGGVLGLRLLDPIFEADFVIVVDAVKGGCPPGTVYRIPEEEVPKKIPHKSSLHELNLVETLAYAEILGNRPEAVIIGIEPETITDWSIELTAPVRECLSRAVSAVLEEIGAAGGSFAPKQQAAKLCAPISPLP